MKIFLVVKQRADGNASGDAHAPIDTQHSETHAAVILVAFQEYQHHSRRNNQTHRFQCGVKQY
tara:strand:+ start:716 stop:904 length:189 start_codon:yes stop_codon:yes gene_type:complete